MFPGHHENNLQQYNIYAVDLSQQNYTSRYICKGVTRKIIVIPVSDRLPAQGI